MTRRRVLLVSCYFPPVGGAGVQRPLKFAKYLPEVGWDVTVLTCKNPSAPLADASLGDEIPPEMSILRAATLEPAYSLKQVADGDEVAPPRMIDRVRRWAKGRLLELGKRLLLPDPQVLWLPGMMRALGRELRSKHYDCVLVTAPPYSAMVGATYVATRLGVPIVLDFRDEWEISAQHLENAARDRLSNVVQRWLQRYVLERSTALIATTRASAERLGELARAVGASPETCTIHNGWDANDFLPNLPERSNRPDTPLEVLYTGTLWNLTDAIPLLHELRALASRRPNLIDRFRFVFVGRKTEQQAAALREAITDGLRVEDVPYLPHADALLRARNADGLLVILSTTPNAERVIPGKLFEYLATGRPILGLMPDGEAAEIVSHAPSSRVLSGELSPGLEEWLNRVAESRAAASTETIPEIATKFERRALTKQLAALLNRVVETSARY